MASQTSPQLEPAIIVIFGITGDLAQRYLLPALYHLIQNDLLHAKTEIIGTSRRDIEPDELLDNIKDHLKDGGVDNEALEKMRGHFRMIKLDPKEGGDYARLRETMEVIEGKEDVCMNRLYYLSIPPQVYGSVIHNMGDNKLNEGCQHEEAASRLLIEKPFGYDMASARELIETMSQSFEEDQIFRIDHYLAKETVQNILTFRFRNPIFEPLWNSDYIDLIEVSASEAIGIEGRVQFYEPLGALRDFIQSHLLQLLAIVTMDRPEAMDSLHIHDSKQALLRQIQSVPADRVKQFAVRGQYEGYRDEVDKQDSSTETFAGLRLTINSPRWKDVPIVLWTGKKLAEKRTVVTIRFKSEPGEATNYLRFRIQPDEGIELDLLAKKPGFETELQSTAMDFSYRQNFKGSSQPDAYERVLVDAVRGDRTLFATSEEVMQAWRIVQPVLDAWSSKPGPLEDYGGGTSGSELAKKLFE